MKKIYEKISEQLITNGIISSEDQEIYIYGLHQGIIMIINIITTLVIGILFGMVWETIIFMVAYLPLRSFAGGYHSRTQLRCYIFSIGLISIALLLIVGISETKVNILILTSIASIVIFLLSPVEDKNKPLDETEIIVYRKRARGILYIEVIINILFLLLGFTSISMCISISLFILSIMLLFGAVNNKLYFQKEELG